MKSRDARASLAPPIRRGMDVYTIHQDRYLGTVVSVSTSGSAPSSRSRGDSDSHKPFSSRLSGEEMGPFPTVTAGNAGPSSQSAANDYAAGAPGAEGVYSFTVRPAGWNPFARRRTIPISAVRSLSLERLLVELT